MLHGMADIIDMVDRMVLQTLENKADADGKVVHLRHCLGNMETRAAVVEWKDNVTVHMQEIGEQCGEDRRWTREMEERINQFQALVVAQGRELEVASNVVWAQNKVFRVQSTLLFEVEWKQAWERGRLDILERRMDPVGRTMGNLIFIEDDEVTLVEYLGVIRELIPINNTDDSSD